MLVFSPGLKAALDSGTLMSDSYNRVTFVEHPFSMLVAAILLTIINKYLKERNISTKSSFHGSSGIAIIWLRFPLG